MSKSRDIADELVSELDVQFGVDATVRQRPRLKLDQMGSQVWYWVVPRGWTIEAEDRVHDAYVYELHIVIQKRLDNFETGVDALIDTVESVSDYFAGLTELPATDVELESIRVMDSDDAGTKPYLVEHAEQIDVFTSAVSLRYRDVR